MDQALLSPPLPSSPEAMIAFAQRLLDAAPTASEADTIAIYIYVDALGSLAERLVEGYREAEEDFSQNVKWLVAALALSSLQPGDSAQPMLKHKELSAQERATWENAATQIGRCASQILDIADSRCIYIPNRYEVPI